MSFDLDWTPDFCLACDKQTDGTVYCSEACRLAEYEKASSSVGSPSSSPATCSSPFSWPEKSAATCNFFMEPADNFTHAQPYGETSSPRTPDFYTHQRPQSAPVSPAKSILTPSSSLSSIFSMQSTSSTSSASSSCTTTSVTLSDETRKELRAYSSSFDRSRNSRRQSAY